MEQALGELDVWKAVWKFFKENSQETMPVNGIEAIEKCDENCFPIIHLMLQILITLPVSTASPERSFSTLKRLKTWLRNSMAEKRLSNLALMAMHREILDNFDANEILNIFAIQKSRRIQMDL